MGRKIPAKKHRGVKDPLVQQARRVQSLQNKINAPPTDPDDQPIPSTLTRLFAFQNKKEDTGKQKMKKKVKKPRIDIDGGKSVCSTHNPVSSLRRLNGESGRAFSLRINSAIKTLSAPDNYNYMEDMESEDVKGDAMAERNEKRARKKARGGGKARSGNGGAAEGGDKLTRGQKLTLRNKARKLKATEAESGRLGIKLRGVALFMDNNTERLGIAFCNALAKNSVTISPGLGALLNGSTSKITMRRKLFDELPQVTVENQTCRIVRKNNKTIALFAAGDVGQLTEFEQMCAVLTSIGNRTGEDEAPKKISVDAMTVGYIKGETKDYVGALLASRHHEMVLYENRGENLSYLLARPHDQGTTGVPVDCWDHPIANPNISGSERLQQRVQQEKSQAENKATRAQRSKLALAMAVLGKVVQAIPNKAFNKVTQFRRALSMEAAVEEFTKKTPRQKSEPPQSPRTKADMGQVIPPKLRPVKEPQDHMINAFMEFVAVTEATLKVSTDICKKIMQTYNWNTQGLLRVLLDEAEAAIYDNDKAQVLMGSMSGSYMAAYSGTCGFVAKDEVKSKSLGNIIFKTPPGDSIVVVAKCTKVMLEDRILAQAHALAGDLYKGGNPNCSWTKPTITWVNGVPGCGKTTWVMSQIDTEKDVIVTTTTEAANDLREKLELRIGNRAKRRVRTMASLLVNGMNEGESCTRLMVDEALMNHFGSIVMAIQLAEASEAVLIGDNNQLPYIDRNNLFPMLYNRPNLVTNITKELLCTYRNPQDVAYALQEIYSGIYSAKSLTKSLSLKRYTGIEIPKQDGTLYLVHTQADKAILISQGYGEQLESRTLTIHEAQGLTYETVVIVRTNPRKSQLLESVPHAVVAISRHTKSCTYYTDSTTDDATARLILSAEKATEAKIRDYNLKMAIRRGDEKAAVNSAVVYERVKFGDVVEAPPTLSAPRRATDNKHTARRDLLLYKMLDSASDTPAQKARVQAAHTQAERREQARLAAVAAYRALKTQRLKMKPPILFT